MIKHILLPLLAIAVSSLAADPVKINVAAQAAPLLTALAALDGQDVIIDQAQPDGTSKKTPVKMAYDFGKDSVKIRLAIRKDLLAIREAAEAFDTTRAGYLMTIFGLPGMTDAEYKAQPAEKRTAYETKYLQLQQPTSLDLALFTDADVTAMAGAGIPGTVSMALDPLVAKPGKK